MVEPDEKNEIEKKKDVQSREKGPGTGRDTESFSVPGDNLSGLGPRLQLDITVPNNGSGK